MKTGKLNILGGVEYRDTSLQSTSTKTELFGPYSDSTIPMPNQAATIDEWIEWIINRLKVITGEAHWYTTPNYNLQEIIGLIGGGGVEALLREENLGDILDVPLARTNLGLRSAALREETFFALRDHLHIASEVSAISTPNVSADNVQEALEGLDYYITHKTIDGGFF